MGGIGALFALALAGAGFAADRGSAFYDAMPVDDPAVGRCDWAGPRSAFVFQENEYIRAYFEPADLVAYAQALPEPFAVPARPLIRVTFLHFYEMASGPTYHEAEVALLATDREQPGWVVLTLPVNNGGACIGGRRVLGLPKVMRRITFERGTEAYVGALYGLGAATPEMTLTVEFADSDAAGAAKAEDLVRQYGAYRPFGLLQGRVVRFAPPAVTAAELAARGDYEIRYGRARLEFSPEPDSLLRRLGVGAPLAAHWTRVRVRYAIKPE